jgi:hypothetical protein
MRHFLFALLLLVGCSKHNFGSSVIQAQFAAGGDLNGTSTSQSVIAIQGNTVPGGSLTAGQFLEATGTTTWDAGPVNLANTNSVTGTLAAGNQAAQTCTGDVTGNTGATVVSAITGSTPILVTPATVEWTKATTSPVLTQATPTTDVATNNLTIQAQGPFASASTNKTPGSVIINNPAAVSGGANTPSLIVEQAGTTYWSAGADGFGGAALWGGSAHAVNTWVIDSSSGTTIFNASSGDPIEFTIGGTVYANFASTDFSIQAPVGGYASGSAPFSWLSCTVSLTSGTVNTLTASQYTCPHLKFTGTLTGAGTVVQYPSTDGSCWDNDFSAIVTPADIISLKANSVTWSTTVTATASEFPHVCYSAGAARLVGNLMTQ